MRLVEHEVEALRRELRAAAVGDRESDGAAARRRLRGALFRAAAAANGPPPAARRRRRRGAQPVDARAREVGREQRSERRCEAARRARAEAGQ